MDTISRKKRKLNYMIHNPNTVEDTAKMLLDILVQANEKKVERKMRELVDDTTRSDGDEEQYDIAKIG